MRELLSKIGSHTLKTKFGLFELSGFTFGRSRQIVLALKKIVKKWDNPYYLRVQYGCINSMVFGSLDCDCNQQLEYSLKRGSNKAIVILYFPDQEGYNLGLREKIVLTEQEEFLGISSVSAAKKNRIKFNEKAALRIVPTLLKKMGLGLSVMLLTNSPTKVELLIKVGLHIQRIEPIVIDQSKLSDRGVLEVTEKNKILGHSNPQSSRARSRVRS